MSGPQHIAWFKTARQEMGGKKLMDLQVLCAPNGSQSHLGAVRDQLLAMSQGKEV